MCCFYCHSCVCRNLRKYIYNSKVFIRSQYTNLNGYLNIALIIILFSTDIIERLGGNLNGIRKGEILGQTGGRANAVGANSRSPLRRLHLQKKMTDYDKQDKKTLQ